MHTQSQKQQCRARTTNWLVGGAIPIPDICRIIAEYNDGLEGNCLQTFAGHPDIVAVLDHGRLASSSWSAIRVWDSVSGVLMRVLEGHTHRVIALIGLPCGKLASGSWDKTLRVWDVAGGVCERVLVGHTSWVNCLTVLPNGNLVSSSNDRTMRVWDLDSGECLRIIECTYTVRSMVVMPCGKLVTGSDDSMVRVWE
jgi:WD40 repeat protein